ncbi:uncharacterized protein LOC120273073 isoform X2 [Dioscorea cayenensis subsp. rotundata]|uniref:Uncharacterized protein LOC120273073 isoform X2 n=1 Tax=Dioscorea cayennensis subsp. rotundata TaxID=55577 RepID=A0AB40C739_DIOCR|nr:uncharacterized protein LOC120273073 isoform X2 [Dioscorea cayenensis subsp. rotundata]
MGSHRDGNPIGDKREGFNFTLELPVTDPTFNLENTVCSHGLFMMSPNHWNSSTKSLHRPLRLSSFPSLSLSVIISHPSPPNPLLISVSGIASLSSQDQLCLLVRRMLRISEENDRVVREFQEMHGASKERGFGRVFRSPTLFEDMVKCILLCNCQWSRTLSMARALCELQRELMGSLVAETFQPKTPQVVERKRKRGRGKKVAIKLETKFVKNYTECAENEKSLVNQDTRLQSVQQCQLSNTDSCSEELQNCSTLAVKDESLQIGNFPSPEELATLDENFLAQRCKLGYRAQRILSLAKDIVAGKINIKKLEENCHGSLSGDYNELDMQLSGIHGFGPFTRANVLMCMGFYHKIPTDTETIRHLKQSHGRSNCTIRSVQDDVEKIYTAYAPYQFLAYWSELWDGYEKRFGKLSEMPHSDYQVITANNMKCSNGCRKV